MQYTLQTYAVYMRPRITPPPYSLICSPSCVYTAAFLLFHAVFTHTAPVCPVCTHTASVCPVCAHRPPYTCSLAGRAYVHARTAPNALTQPPYAGPVYTDEDVLDALEAASGWIEVQRPLCPYAMTLRYAPMLCSYDVLLRYDISVGAYIRPLRYAPTLCLHAMHLHFACALCTCNPLIRAYLYHAPGYDPTPRCPVLRARTALCSYQYEEVADEERRIKDTAAAGTTQPVLLVASYDMILLVASYLPDM